jgi:hypothetical protein
MIKFLKAGLFMAAILLPLQTRAAWDDPPILNSVQAATGNLSINFGMPGVHQQIAIFLVNSNDPAGFHIDFTFANKGFFKTGTRQFAMTSVRVAKYGGTLGTGLDPAEATLTVDGTTGVATWFPSGTPSSATDNCVIAIYASWADHSSGMAGFYLESITASIVSGP